MELRRKIYKLELKRAFQSWGFFVALATGCILVLLETLNMYESYLAVIRTRETVDMVVYASNSMWGLSYTLDGYFWTTTFYCMIVPLLAALPFGGSYLSDRRSGYLKNILVRADRKDYFRAKFLAVFFSGALVVTLPLLLNLGLVLLYAPIKNVDIEAVEINVAASSYYKLYIENTALYVLYFVAVVFFNGGFFAVLALLLSQITDYAFTVWSGPFLISLIIQNVADFLGAREWIPTYYMMGAQPYANKWYASVTVCAVLCVLTVVSFLGRGPAQDVI